jgi:hypothetical protein
LTAGFYFGENGGDEIDWSRLILVYV